MSSRLELPPPHGAARQWIADPLSLMWVLALAALTLIGIGGWRAGDEMTLLAVGLAAVIAGVSLSGST